MSKTKIVATIGPSCDSPEMIEKLIVAGVDIFRFNLKHNDQTWHNSRIQRVKAVFQSLNRPSSILLDLQGPEIRIGTFEELELPIEQGETIRFALKREKGEKTIVVDNLKLLKSLGIGQRILIDDGQFEFAVTKTGSKDVHALVIKGGVLKSRKGVNISSPPSLAFR